MGNTSFRCSTSTSSDDENQNAVFQPEDVLDGLDELMTYIEKCLAKATATYKAEENTSGVDCTASSRVASLIKEGRNLLNNVLKRFKKPPSQVLKVPLLFSSMNFDRIALKNILFLPLQIMSGETRKLVIDVLKGASEIQWVGAGLSIVAYLLSETDMLDQQDIITRSEYCMKPLQCAESKKLLSKKVFGNPDATFDSSSDIDGLVNICGGIPLVLDLVGSRLHRDRDPNNLSSLNNTIEYFKNSLATGESELIDKVVDVVYESLRDHYKDAFLDIAAFFSNWERRIVSYIVGEMELKTLEDVALVKISNCRVQLHDVVLRRGRKLSESDRITDPQSLANILEDPQGQKKVYFNSKYFNEIVYEDFVDQKIGWCFESGISLMARLEKLKGIWLPWIVDDEPAFQLLAKHLDRMGNLRILCLTSGTTVTGVCTRKFENLRYLSVFKGQSSPMELNKLPRLAIFEGRIRSDNRFCDLPHSLRSLKVYDFEFLELDERFGNLVQLEELELWQDKQYIRKLLESFGQLRSLRRLSLCNFRELICLPESFGQLRNLKELNMSDCPKLFSLCRNFGQLKSLVYLRLRGCRSLQRLSDDFISLSCVTAIDASGCPVLEGNAVDQMIRLESLMMLDIKESPMLISRCEEVKEGHPLLVCTERFRDGRDRENMYNHSMSTVLFDGASRFVSVNGVVADWSSIVRPIRCFKKLALLLTCRDLCSSSNEEACEMVKKKIVDLLVRIST
ncbi:disease resistance protein RPV1-like [Cryptomeria japonica]|uniref:disease resistance protein RPV1-like n=1 Tax=Cryptomeria japonica TaxID=3369 RepID=UPI0027DA7E6F|nr:disease resistance protein RPV1-like [Cryptomeria japonica]